MKVAPENLNALVSVIRWGLLGLGAVFLFADLTLPALVFFVASLVFNRLLRREGFRRWFIEKFVDLKAGSAAPQASGAGQSLEALAGVMPIGGMAQRMGGGPQSPPDLAALAAMVEDKRQQAILLKRVWPADGPGHDANSWLGGMSGLATRIGVAGQCGDGICPAPSGAKRSG